MTERLWQIGLFGTFDVENYGDLLFPLIAEAELTERLGTVELHRFSYNAKTPPDWPYSVTSVKELPGIAGRLDGALIGGGFLIRFDKSVAPDYGPPTAAIHHPTGYWLTPALIALQHCVPLIWNAPGMHSNEIPEWADPLMELALTLSQYIAVRDEPSQAALVRFVDKHRIAVVPDTGFGIARLLGGQPSFELNRLREASGLTGPYVVMQASSSLDGFFDFVKRHARRFADYRFLVLPISPGLGDDSAILGSDLPGLVRLPVWPGPLLLAELISKAAAAVGHSYHLAVTATASGVPAFTPVDLSEGKFTALSRFDTIHSVPTSGELDPDWFLARLGKSEPSSAARVALDELSQHWDRVAAAVRAGATDSHLALSRFWQSLPGLLESRATRLDATFRAATEMQRSIDEAGIRAAESEAAQAQHRVDELNKLIELARAEIVRRDQSIAALRQSPSWTLTAPLRLMMRNLKRLARTRDGE